MLSDILTRLKEIEGATPVSYSRMKQLFNCPLAWVLRYITKAKLPASQTQLNDDITIGKWAHWIMEKTVRHAVLRNEYSLPLSDLNFLHSHVMKSATDSQKERLTELRSPMGEVCKRLFRLMSLPGTQVYTEKNIRLNLDGTPRTDNEPFRGYGKKPRIGFTGYIDLEMKNGGNINLVDYKTELPSESRRVEVIDQTAVYAYIEFLSDPALTHANTYCIYLRDGTVDKVAAYNKATNFNELEDKVLGMFTEYQRILQEGVVPEPKENKYCIYCDYKKAGLCTL